MWRYFFIILPLLFLQHVECQGQGDAGKTCMDCHAELMTGRNIHPPAEESCDYCHEPTGKPHPGNEGKAFTMADDLPALCYMCHDENTRKHIHPPVEAGECVMCHSPHSSSNPTLLLASPVADLCFECHDRDEIMKHDVAHPPVSEGECQYCHNPHQSDNRSLLNEPIPNLCFECHEEIIQGKTAKYLHAPVEDDCRNCHQVHGSKKQSLLDLTTPDLCFECHDRDEIMNHNVEHPPVSEGECLFCHNPHQSDYRPILESQMPELCFNCHDEPAAQMKEKHVHPPFEDDCRNCHFVHGSKENNLLDFKTDALCFECHDDIKELIASQPVVHGAVRIKKTCINCHSPHASAQEKFLLDENIALCLKCHNKSITTETKKLANIQQKINSAYVHPAIEFDGCSGCHSAHASPSSFLLVDKFPEGVYTPANPDNFALCFSCHDSEMIEKEHTTTATNFRNGDKNLHYFHINGEKGRSCKDCHDMHGSPNEHMIAVSIPFGNWNMPIQYTASENGGSCLSGCHSEKKYSRD